MLWLILAILAYFMLAIVNVADKFIIEKVLPGPKTYTFLVGVTGLIVLLAAPWLLVWPGWGLLFFNFLVGAFFAGGLFFLYSALKGGEATRIFTFIGGAVPLFTVLLSVGIWQENFTNHQWLAILFLILGSIIIATVSIHHNIWFNIRKFLHFTDENKWPSFMATLISAMLFSLFWIGTKQVYNTQDFASGFIWIRIGTFLTVLFLIIYPSSRREILAEIKESNQNKNNKFIYFSTQGLGALGGILQNYAVALASVALVTSLQGLQYALLLIFSAIVSFFYPKIIKEDYALRRTIKKILAIIFIGFGLYFLVF